MAWAIVGILAGIILGLISNLTIPIEYIKYTAVVILGILDSLFGGIKAEVTHDDQYSSTIFLTGLLGNILLALGITLLGEKLGLDLYLAATIVFVFRIFSNLGITRRILVDRFYKKKSKKN